MEVLPPRTQPGCGTRRRCAAPSTIAVSKDVINVVDAGSGGIDLDNPADQGFLVATDAWAPTADSWSGLTIPSMMDNVVPVSACAWRTRQDPTTGMLEPSFTANWGKQTVAFAAPVRTCTRRRPGTAASGGVVREFVDGRSVAAGVIATLRQVHPEMILLRFSSWLASGGAPAGGITCRSRGERSTGAGLLSASGRCPEGPGSAVVGDVRVLGRRFDVGTSVQAEPVRSACPPARDRDQARHPSARLLCRRQRRGRDRTGER